MVKYTRLTYAERKRIEQLKSQGSGVRDIAKALDRSSSTISTELARCPRGYTADKAQAHAERRRQWRKPRPKIRGPLEEIILFLLIERRFSPEQISAYLKIHYTDQPDLWVCHESIYRWVYGHPKRTQIVGFLRKRRKYRRKRRKTPVRRGGIKNRVSIHERPVEIEDRRQFGHWEADLIIGERGQSCMGTLVERTSRYTILVRLGSKESEEVVEGFIKALSHLPPDLRRSITYDNGSELAYHERITETLGTSVYFADPRSPWQRGTNENTNGFIREFYPKGTDLSVHSSAQMAGVAALLNLRPRKILGFLTPEDILEQHWISICPP